jgi:glycosyltransferase involved in cell wall biosynthesis
MTVCALIPAYNEEATIEAVVRGAMPHVEEVVVVDDGSSDGTSEHARKAGATVLRLTRNSGKGSAIRAGLAYVLGRQCSHVLFMDADLQHDPADVVRLIAAARSGQGDFIAVGVSPDRNRSSSRRHPDGARLRDRDRDADQAGAPGSPAHSRASAPALRGDPKQAEAGQGHGSDLFSGRALSIPRGSAGLGH